MLPNIKTLRTTAVAGIAALGIAASLAAPAQAFGDKDRAFVQGIATAVIVDKLIEQGRTPRYRPAPQPYAYAQPYGYAPQPVYVQPRYSIYSTPAARAFAEYAPSTRRAIQANLADYGYYRGGIDGQWGPGTYRAVEAYARGEGRGNLLDSRDGAVRLYNGLLRRY
ncbi:MAG: peptidoglycan-binding domain-containing protein [Paracoccaceae bacterium]